MGAPATNQPGDQPTRPTKLGRSKSGSTIKNTASLHGTGPYKKGGGKGGTDDDDVATLSGRTSVGWERRWEGDRGTVAREKEWGQEGRKQGLSTAVHQQRSRRGRASRLAT